MTEHNAHNPDQPQSGQTNGQQEEEVRITDKRRIDPETGELRDAVGQTEDIINNAAADAEAEVEDTPADPTQAQPDDTELVSELRNDLQRLQAEYVNYRRRVERDRNVAKDNAIFSVLQGLLPVLDDIDAARDAGDLTDGPMAAIAKKLDTTLESFGMVRQDQESLAGQEFDPAQHEAMIRQPNAEIPADHIVQVFRNGYLREERVIRAAQVMVSAGDE